MSTEIAFFTPTKAAWDGMFEACSKARHSIDFEQYILEPDSIGGKFLTLFAEKARKGVRVRLILDAIGSRNFFRSDWPQKLEEAGVSIAAYNRFAAKHLLLPKRLLPRNHAKTLLIDEQTGIMGSACLSDEMKSWHDLQVQFHGQGTVDQARKDFGRLWQAMEKRERYKIQENAHPHAELAYFVSQPRVAANPIYRELLKEIRNAQQTIVMVTPYFLPPTLLLHELHRASRRGVKITVMMGARTDVRIADLTAQSYLAKWRRLGIEVLLYTRCVLHSKYSVIDGKWATVGSTNLDHLSLILNREANLIMRDEASVAMLLKNFADDCKDCIKGDASVFKSLPLKDRLLGYAGRLGKKVL
jgi:cardiolipin synthase